jgi:hypothetical protein
VKIEVILLGLGNTKCVFVEEIPLAGLKRFQLKEYKIINKSESINPPVSERV